MESKISKFIFKYRSMFTEINEDYVCVCCKKLLCDPCSSSCGCNYCRECINVHFSDGNTCRGENEDCNKTNLENGQFLTSFFLCKKIKKLEVFCPHEDCKFNSSIENVVKHIEECKKRYYECEFGCVKEVQEEYKEEHLNSNMMNHLNYLLQKFNGMEEEMILLRNDNNELKLKERAMCDRMNLVQSANDDLLRNIEVVTNKNIELESKIGELENKNLELTENVEEIERKNGELQNKFVNLEQQILEIKSNYESEIKRLQNENETVKLKQTTLERSINETTEIVNKDVIQEEIVHRLRALETFRSDSECYIWKVEDLLEERTAAQSGRNTEIWSEFYINKYGYRMRIYIYPNGKDNVEGSHLSVGFCICDGDFDDILEWPMKRTVKICLVNQTTLTECNTKMYNYETTPPSYRECFEKPLKETIVRPINNYGSFFDFGQKINYETQCYENTIYKPYSYPKFISWKELESQYSPMKNGIIYIKISLEK